MNDTLLMGVFEAAGSLQDKVCRCRRRNRMSLGDMAQIAAVDKFHYQEVVPVGLVGIVRGDNVGMGQPRRRLHFAAESGRAFPANRSTARAAS